MQHITKLLLLLLIFLLPVSVCLADDPEADDNAFPVKPENAVPVKPKVPKWSFELKGGLFAPDIDDWKLFYGDDKTKHFATSVAYKVLRQLELGIEGGWITDKGKGLLPANGTLGGEVDYTLYPLNFFILYRAVFTPRQLVVPYIGGGWSRLYYKQKIKNQSSIDGVENGTHYRAGLQFLLNNVNKKAAYNLKNFHGVKNTYIFIEMAVLDVEVSSTRVDLGGKSYLAGFLMEF